MSPTMGLTLGGPGNRQVLGSPSLSGPDVRTSYVVGRRTYGLQDKQFGGDNLQFPIFEGKLKYEWLSVTCGGGTNTVVFAENLVNF
jgi:hypothetical protein